MNECSSPPGAGAIAEETMAEGSRLKTVRIGVVEHGRPRALATLAEMATGDVIVDLRARRFLSDVPVPFASPEPADAGTNITEFRFTIHPSINSPEAINFINLHVTLTDEPRVISRHVTPAIKEQPGRFSFLFSRLYPVLSDPTYDFAKPTERFEIDWIERPSVHRRGRCLCDEPCHPNSSRTGRFQTSNLPFQELRDRDRLSLLHWPSIPIFSGLVMCNAGRNGPVQILRYRRLRAVDASDAD
ncbi:hypothetical protein ABIE41_004438 [Bosea sp. OAE506]